MTKAYFIGIAGKTMAPLAKALQDAGWQVSGSDHKGIYPPMSTYLAANHLSYVEGYAKDNVPTDTDVIVVGRSALLTDPNNPEFQKAQTLGCPTYSYPQFLEKYLIKKNSIVIAGSYGKTTTSAIITWILTSAGQKPSYMVSGLANNLTDGVKLTDSDYSVTEGDETPDLRATDPPKFMFYHPKYLLLTATKWDHPEIYQTQAVYQNAFIKLCQTLPADGLLVYNLDNVAKKVVAAAKCKTVSYSYANPQADYLVTDPRYGQRTTFTVVGNGKILHLTTSLLGESNLENICGAVALCDQLNLSRKIISSSITSFTGVKTRLEYLGTKNGINYYWDIAQHPAKVQGSLTALKTHFPQGKLLCVFDPTASVLKHRQSLAWYKSNFTKADLVLVGKVSFDSKITKNDRVTGAMIVTAINQAKHIAEYLPLESDLLTKLNHVAAKGDTVIFMSSGGIRFTNLISAATGKAIT